MIGKAFFLAATFIFLMMPLMNSAEVPVADSFVFPLQSYKVGCNSFWGTCYRPAWWHLGDDAAGLVGDEVRAIGNGIAVHAENHPRTWTKLPDGTWKENKNYGFIIIIEHLLPNSEIICSLYCHLGSKLLVKAGDVVKKGGPIGYIGNTEENGGYEVHLHLGIRKAKYNSYNYECNGHTEWSYAGYTQCAEQKNNWYSPSDFITAHSQPTPASLVGFWSGGWNTEGSSEAIKKAYDDAGGEAVVGVPESNAGGGKYVHLYFSVDASTYVIIQDFYKVATNDWFAIIYNPTLKQAFLLKGGFRWYYTSQVDGPKVFGAPLGSEDGKVLIDSAGSYDYPGVIYKIQSFASRKSLIVATRPDAPAGARQVRMIDTPADFGGAMVGPLTLRGWALDSTRAHLEWSGGVGLDADSWYEVIQNEVSVATTSGNSIIANGLMPATTYAFRMALVDRVYGRLEQSNTLTITTKAPTPSNSSLPTFWHLH